MTLYEPHNLWGIVGIIIIGLFVLAQAWFSRRDHKSQNVILDEVQRLVTDVRDDIGEVRKDVGGLRSEVRQERAERADLSRRVDHLDELRRESFG